MTHATVSIWGIRLRSILARHWVIFLALLLYLPLIFLGYGSDVDTYRVLDSGRNFFLSADYVPSRRPGFLVHEMATFMLDSLGGSLLANLGTLFWALVALTSFLSILRRHRIAHADLLALAFAIHPVFWFNATATADYIWAMGMLLAGFDFLERKQFGWAGLALGLAIGCRISSGLVAILLLVFAWLVSPGRRRQVAAGAVLAALLGGLAYVLPWDFAEWRSSFWDISTGSPALWTVEMQIGRFFYKNLYFWGVPAALFVIFMLFRTTIRVSSWIHAERAYLAGFSLLILLSLEALFFRYPIEVEYLLPTLPFWIILVGLGLSNRRKWVILFVLLIFSFNLVNLNLAQPNEPGQASSATLGVWLEPGYLVKEITLRLTLLGCDSHTCYDERITHRPVRE